MLLETNPKINIDIVYKTAYSAITKEKLYSLESDLNRREFRIVGSDGFVYRKFNEYEQAIKYFNDFIQEITKKYFCFIYLK